MINKTTNAPSLFLGPIDHIDVIGFVQFLAQIYAVLACSQVCVESKPRARTNNSRNAPCLSIDADAYRRERCTFKPHFPSGLSITIEEQNVSPRFTRQVAPTTPADTLKIVLLGDEVSFDCAVESADVTEVSIWWQKDEANLTISDTAKYSLEVRFIDHSKQRNACNFRLTRPAREWCPAS